MDYELKDKWEILDVRGPRRIGGDLCVTWLLLLCLSAGYLPAREVFFSFFALLFEGHAGFVQLPYWFVPPFLGMTGTSPVLHFLQPLNRPVEPIMLPSTALRVRELSGRTPRLHSESEFEHLKSSLLAVSFFKRHDDDRRCDWLCSHTGNLSRNDVEHSRIYFTLTVRPDDPHDGLSVTRVERLESHASPPYEL